MNVKQIDVTNAVLGLIKAQDPCDIPFLIYECFIQVADFEKLNKLQETCMVDFALNQLLESGQIEIETCYDDRVEKGRDLEYTVCFRNKQSEVNNG